MAYDWYDLKKDVRKGNTWSIVAKERTGGHGHHIRDFVVQFKGDKIIYVAPLDINTRSNRDRSYSWGSAGYKMIIVDAGTGEVIYYHEFEPNLIDSLEILDTMTEGFLSLIDEYPGFRRKKNNGFQKRRRTA